MLIWVYIENLQNFCSLVDDILTKADSLATQSIAIPPIGTGNLRYPASFIAKMIVKGIDDYVSSRPGTHLKDVRFVLLETDKALIRVRQNNEKFIAQNCGAFHFAAKILLQLKINLVICAA